jgi:phenylpropionate dioxygenase-like ring-hydroxylating dioxygenase large terminal subunit
MRRLVCAEPAGTGAPEGRIDPRAMKFRHTSVQTPETLGTTHYFFCQARNFALDNAAMTETIFQDVSTAFAEDRTIIEGQQRILHTDPDFHPVATAHDMGLNQARFLLQRRLQQEQSARTGTPS